VQLPASLRVERVDHHAAHAATAYFTSPFDRAAVLVCDTHASRQLSVWLGDGGRLVDLDFQWQGPAFAALYTECAQLFGFPGADQTHRLEALAHLGQGDVADRLAATFQYADGRIALAKDWRCRVVDMLQEERQRHGHSAATARAVQHRIGELLLELLGDVRRVVDVDTVCLGGGLFYNTYFNALVSASGLFTRTFVPINPGNAGLSVGAALMVGRCGDSARARTLSPFLGPAYDTAEIKATLDGCKLSYDFVGESEAQDAAVGALVRGQLVGWFGGRMEWGHRSLGHRSILANPLSRYVLDNLNFFLRKRERSRPFGVAVPDDSLHDLFCARAPSPFMEFEYIPKGDWFQHAIPTGASTLRVQTVSREEVPFWSLLKRMEQATGIGALVNTSFNGFQEPIVCTPRDAVRVFFGTGLDMLVLGRFIVRK
jgi:carbamoyltransferase